MPLQHLHTDIKKRMLADLRSDLVDLREIFWAPADREQKAWALQMIKSIEHDIDQLQP